MGVVGKLASLLMTGCANDSQLKTLLNYLLMQHGHKPCFGMFIRKVTTARRPHSRGCASISFRETDRSSHRT